MKNSKHESTKLMFKISIIKLKSNQQIDKNNLKTIFPIITKGKRIGIKEVEVEIIVKRIVQKKV